MPLMTILSPFAFKVITYIVKFDLFPTDLPFLHLIFFSLNKAFFGLILIHNIMD